jgi:hypothetical protein
VHGLDGGICMSYAQRHGTWCVIKALRLCKGEPLIWQFDYDDDVKENPRQVDAYGGGTQLVMLQMSIIVAVSQ